jgi:hypothetical protein
VGEIILAPLQYWMIRRGYQLSSGLERAKTSRVLLPSQRVAWPALLITFVVAVAALAVTVGQLA